VLPVMVRMSLRPEWMVERELLQEGERYLLLWHTWSIVARHTRGINLLEDFE
jgi:hypothetical protein